jgi:hypothetical protein
MSEKPSIEGFFVPVAFIFLRDIVTDRGAALRYGRRLAYSGNARTSGRLRTAPVMSIAQGMAEVRVGGRFPPYSITIFHWGSLCALNPWLLR